MGEVFQKADKHLLIRFSDKLDSIPEDGTIREHEKIIRQKGHVWIGKFGKALGKNHIACMTSQIKKSIKTYLFLVQTKNKKYEIFFAPLIEIKVKISIMDLEYVPTYYRECTARVGTWFKVKKFQKMPSELLNAVLISSSGMRATETLKSSMAGAFIVRLTEDVLLQNFVNNKG